MLVSSLFSLCLALHSPTMSLWTVNITSNVDELIYCFGSCDMFTYFFIFRNCLILIFTYRTYFIVLLLLSISLFHSVQNLLSIKPLQLTDKIWQPPTDKILPLLNKTKCYLAIFDYIFDQAIIENATQRNCSPCCSASSAQSRSHRGTC